MSRFLGIECQSPQIAARIKIADILGDNLVAPIYSRKPLSIFDIGAHVGIVSLEYARQYPCSTIYSFEPNPDNYQLMQANLRRHSICNVIPYNVAISDKTGIMDFYCHQTGSWGDSFIRQPGLNKVITVNSITLSEFLNGNNIPKIDILKMDVEGHEDRIFQDIHNNQLGVRIKNIVFEYHPQLLRSNDLKEILHILRSNNFNYTIGLGIWINRINEYWALRERKISLIIHAKNQSIN